LKAGVGEWPESPDRPASGRLVRSSQACSARGNGSSSEARKRYSERPPRTGEVREGRSADPVRKYHIGPAILSHSMNWQAQLTCLGGMIVSGRKLNL
jgi:hypothetical protein